MKNKIIIFLILSVLLVPGVSNAVIMMPSASLTIIVNTQVSDSSFNFNLKDCPTIICDNPIQINLQTQNLSATTILQISAFPNEKYYLEKENIPGLKTGDILCTSDNPANTFWYQADSVSFSPSAWSNITCTFNNVKIQEKTPVLIVPGILGTEMLRSSERLWPDATRMMTDISDSFMDPLSFNEDLNPSDNSIIAGKVLSKEIIFDYTEGLINEFKNQGYVEGQDLFTFPYDWRYGVSGKFADNTTNVDLLKTKIDNILQQTGADKIDVVAHSLGGLMFKKYVMGNQASHHIDKAVFIGVPNTGSPKAVKTLLQGDNLGVLGLSDTEIKKIAENMPGIYDTLPSQQYYNVKGSYIQTIDETQSDDGITPYIIKDLNHQESDNFLTEKNLNSLAIGNADTLHAQNFDNFDLRTAQVDLYAIDGCKSATLNKIIYRKYRDVFGQQFSYDVRFAPGDNTVPLESATNLPIDSANKYYALVAEHGKMPSQNGIRQQITNIITGSTLDIGSSYGQPIITQDILKCQLNGKAISVFSPVNIFVTDQNGNRLGLAEDGSIINEIPNAGFEIMGDHKFVYLPTDNGQTYTANLTGTDTGTYTIKVDNIQNTQTTKTEVFSNLPVTAVLTGTVNLGDAGNSTTLTVKQTPTSEPITILPTPDDTVAPEVIIEFDPVTKDLKFSAVDDSPTTISDKDDVITLTDKAGNKTEIKLKDKDRKHKMKAEIKEIKYNGVLADITKNNLAFLWLFDKNKNLKMLSQLVVSKKGFNILAVYDGKNTTLTGKDSSGKINKTEKGLKLLKITTNNGGLLWSN